MEMCGGDLGGVDKLDSSKIRHSPERQRRQGS